MVSSFLSPHFIFVLLSVLFLSTIVSGKKDFDCPEGTRVQYSSSVQHGRRVHCVCEEGSVCVGPNCSHALEDCKVKCKQVSGFAYPCSNCHCVALEGKSLSAHPEEIFLSLADGGKAFSINFATKDVSQHDTDNPYVIVWVNHNLDDANEHEIIGDSKTTTPMRMTASTPLVLIGVDENNDDDSEDRVKVVAEERKDVGESRIGFSLWMALVQGFEGKNICYIVVNGDSYSEEVCAMLPTTSFQGVTTEGKITIGVVGDLGLSYSAPMVMQAMKERRDLNLFVHPGDVSYAFEVQDMNLYLNRMEGIIKHVPYLVCLGNHESNNKGVLDAFVHRFPTDLLGMSSGSNSSHWYSFEAYGCHFTVLDSMANLDLLSSAQSIWIEEDLKLAAQHRMNGDVVFLFVVLHYPLYSTHRRSNPGERLDKVKQMDELRQNLEPLFKKYGVDVVFAGHDHVYKRTVNVLRGEKNPEGPIHLLVGTGGHNIYASWYNLPDYDAYRRATPGFGTLTLFANKTALWEFNEVSISPCITADNGGNKDCPQALITKANGNYSPDVIKRDSVWLFPRRLPSQAQSITEKEYMKL
eukprot:m.138914 g.138914  ORF g.138914 m.138914 type:complete len:580 (-) comp17896_c0_seq1:54-1793(-)